jgi:hypothetical protein
MDELKFNIFKSYFETLENIAEENNKERFNFLQMKFQELEARIKYQNNDVAIFAEYVADVGKGLIPVPQVIEHSFPNYNIFFTHKDGSFHSGDYEVYQLWLCKNLSKDQMAKTKPIKIDRLIIVILGGLSSASFIVYVTFLITTNLIINPAKYFANWWIQDTTITSPWEVGKADKYDYSRDNMLRVLKERKFCEKIYTDKKEISKCVDQIESVK